MPRSNRNTPTSGRSGSLPPPRRSATRRSSSTRDQSHWVIPRSVSFTHTAEAVTQTASACTSTLPSQLRSLRGLLEPVAWKAGTAGSEGAPARRRAGATRLEGYLLPARGRGLGLLAGQRPGCEEPAWPRQDRHPGLDLAGEGGRAGYVLAVAGASRADPPVARPDPVPPRPGRRPGPGDAAGGEAARGRPNQDLFGAHRGAWGVRAGDDGSADRRQTRPAHAGPARAGTGEGEDRSARGGAARVLHRPSCGDAADDAGQHRPHERPDHRP